MNPKIFDLPEWAGLEGKEVRGMDDIRGYPDKLKAAIDDPNGDWTAARRQFNADDADVILNGDVITHPKRDAATLSAEFILDDILDAEVVE